jgi:hypothetical protein
MRVRAMSPTGDMTFGRGEANFLIKTPTAVAQTIRTRLALWVGQWYLDLTVGMPWLQQVLGKGTIPYYDTAIRSNIEGAPGVTGIASYSSSLNTTTRALSLQGTVNTQYGQVILNTVNVTPPTP